MIASRVPCDVNFYVEILSDNSLEQVVCTCAFSPGKGQWCHTAGKVTVGLALLWPCATDLSHRLKVHVQAFFCKSLQTSVTLINGSLPTPAVGACRVISGICDCVVSVCVPRSKRKTAWAINTKLGRLILYGRCSACINAEVKTPELGEGHTATKIVTEPRLYLLAVMPPAVSVCSCCQHTTARRVTAQFSSIHVLTYLRLNSTGAVFS